jgi:Raf kinase inhibitor-like YbhB/YbcL family protein
MTIDKIRTWAALLLPAALALSWCAGGALAADAFALTSTTFKDGETMPNRSANDLAGRCAGQNVSPQLAWSNAPEGTKSFALAIIDPQGRNGLGVFHLVAYGVPASVTAFPEGAISAPSDKYVGGKNSLDVGHYSGPCPPPGAPHHYSFVIIATDLAPDALPPGLTLPALLAKLEGHAKGSTGMVGLFGAQ